MKKEFTDRRPKEYESKSDVELIEMLDSGTLGEWQRDSIKALLDKRTKRTLQYLTELIHKEAIENQESNKELLMLTKLIVFLTVVMLVGVGLQIYLSLVMR